MLYIIAIGSSEEGIISLRAFMLLLIKQMIIKVFHYTKLFYALCILFNQYQIILGSYHITRRTIFLLGFRLGMISFLLFF